MKIFGLLLIISFAGQKGLADELPFECLTWGAGAPKTYPCNRDGKNYAYGSANCVRADSRGKMPPREIFCPSDLKENVQQCAKAGGTQTDDCRREYLQDKQDRAELQQMKPGTTRPTKTGEQIK